MGETGQLLEQSDSCRLLTIENHDSEA